jgi:hypothetical protein
MHDPADDRKNAHFSPRDDIVEIALGLENPSTKGEMITQMPSSMFTQLLPILLRSGILTCCSFMFISCTHFSITYTPSYFRFSRAVVVYFSIEFSRYGPRSLVAVSLLRSRAKAAE